MDVRSGILTHVSRKSSPMGWWVSPYSLDVKSHRKVRDAGEPEGTGFRSTGNQICSASCLNVLLGL